MSDEDRREISHAPGQKGKFGTPARNVNRKIHLVEYTFFHIFHIYLKVVRILRLRIVEVQE